MMAFLCRAWARNKVMEEVRPLVRDEGARCPFDTSGEILLNSDSVTAEHYLELLLGLGPADSCPQAQKYLSGIALDMPLSQQPYHCRILETKGGFQPEQSVLSVVMSLDQKGENRDFQEDLALAVAVKA